MAVFAITMTVPAFKDGLLNEAINTSCRESRAKRHARKLRDGGNRSVMLFKKAGDSWLPISFKHQGPKVFPQQGVGPNANSVFINLHPENSGDELATRVQVTNVRMNQLARKAHV